MHINAEQPKGTGNYSKLENIKCILIHFFIRDHKRTLIFYKGPQKNTHIIPY